MAKGVKHYFKNGKEHTGATHKDAKGQCYVWRASHRLQQVPGSHEGSVGYS